MNKLNRLTSKITAVMSLSVIVGLGGMTIFGNKNGKSFSENRELTKFTKPSFETVYDGRSAEQLDGYFTDHFTDRSKWLYFKSLIEAEVSESIVNGVYVSSERLLDTENTHLNEKMLSYNADIINNFAQKYDGTAYFVAVPSSTGIYGDVLPSHVVEINDNQKINMLYEILDNGIRKIDAYNILKMMKESYIYFRNDTKWTSYGAYCVYKTVIQKLGFIPTSYDKYTVEHVNDKFRGTLYNRTLSKKPKADVLDKYVYFDGAEVLSCERIQSDGTSSEGVLIDMSRLSSSDMYSMYLGEDIPVLKIKTSAQSEKKLLVIKDSYADCFIPFLTQHYSEITVVSSDILEGSLSEFVDVNEYPQTLFMFGIENFDKGSSLEKITERN